MRAASPATTIITATAFPPKCIRMTIMNAQVNATPAVMNHPPMTESTPVTLNTALSRLHARSASEEPMATMNVTYVVERGSLSDVPSAMSREATTRLVEALTRS